MSIRTILLAAASVVCMAALGQKSITAQECWLDGNFAARQPATPTVDISGLAVGLHSYSVRVQDSEGLWSSAVTKYFVIPSSVQPATSISACEYWLDGDMATRTTIGASPAPIDIADLAIGLHTFTIRAQDNNGVWSSPVTKYFIKEAVVEPTTIARYMYWFDDDETNRVTGELTEASGVLPITLPGTLAGGTHTLSWRVGDSKGVWSNVRTESFVLEDPEPSGSQQDEDEYYLLGSAQDWQDFATLVQTTPTAKAKMTADINLGDDQTMVGTDAVPYAGIFDGQGHTLTVNYNIYSVETAVAPFACVNGATILNLHVAGSIRQRRCAAGGVVGSVNGNLTVKKCWVSATLTVDGEGNYQGTIGGIASCCDNSSAQGKSILLEDCLFSGYVATGIHCGGLMSHVHGESYNNSAAFNNCLNIGTCNGPSGSTGTFIRTGVQGDPYTITNCYYKTAWRVAQGAQATETELADGTTTAALQNSRAEEIWVQEGEMPMLKIFASADPGPATSIDKITTNDQPLTTNKILRDGQLLILRGDKVYTLQGQGVK